MKTRYLWRDRAGGPDMVVYLNRHQIQAPYHDAGHCHDYAEFIYIRSGTVTHIVNGRPLPLQAGELIFLRPDDHHGMESRDHSDFIFDVIAFRHQHIETLLRLCPKELAPFRLAGDAQRSISLNSTDRRWFDRELHDLAAESDSQFLLHRFILNIAQRYRQQCRPQDAFALPEWLADCLHLLQQPQHFSKGPRALAALSGRSFEHVSRTLQRCLGQSPSQACNRARIEYAASQLVLSEEPIINIALDCGFQSLAHFYREFRKRYNIPPRQYRLQNQSKQDPY